LELRGVSKIFHRRGAPPIIAARAVDLEIFEGETVALVGESGSGKSSLARIALGLLRPDQGEVRLLGQTISDLPMAALRRLRTAMQPVFQDSVAAFNPRRPVLQLMAQAARRPGVGEMAMRESIVAVLEQVGLRPGGDYLERFPHELSGGQRQRLAIARALATDPALIIADEPLSGADVSIRGQILNLLLEIQRQRNVAVLFITHDIAVAQSFAHRVAVMYRGAIVEHGASDRVLAHPRHDYTRRLVAAALRVDSRVAPS
jgi:ABC-type oligopeptide transport system ATPase subunit